MIVDVISILEGTMARVVHNFLKIDSFPTAGKRTDDIYLSEYND